MLLLGLFLAGMGQFFQVGRDSGVAVLKRVFLTPLNDGSRADPLYDPVIDRAVWASVQQNVGDVVANRESRIGWLRSHLSRDQGKLILLKTRFQNKWGEGTAVDNRFIHYQIGCPE